MKKIVILLGPTAVGKSDIGVKLAQHFNGEIISADSVQIYRGLNIGSAKITREEMQGVPHHAIDILDANQEFSVFEFVELTRRKIDEISSRGKLPLIVGGTGLYVRALLGGYDFGGAGKNSDFRAKLETYETEELYSKLKACAPQMCEKIKPADRKRIIRALEVHQFGGRPTSSGNDYDAFIINLCMDREVLYDRINRRADLMLEAGLIDEVKGLISSGVKSSAQSMKAIGYKEVIAYLEGTIKESEMIELIKKHTRNYAKRQMTFFRSLKEAKVYSPSQIQEIIGEVEKWIVS